MVAVEIPVVERPHVVALIGNVAVQRGHGVQVRRTHAYSSFRHESSPASPELPDWQPHSWRTSLNLSRTECGLRGTIPGVPRPEPLRHVTPRRTCAEPPHHAPSPPGNKVATPDS